VLEDTVYTVANKHLNKVVYSQLATATVEGVAYHLVSKHEDTENGYAARKSLVDWYDGDMIQNKTAKNLRNKLENLGLHTGVSASKYINKFFTCFWRTSLIRITRLQLLIVLQNRLFCIAAMSKQERDIQQKKVDRHRLKATLHRMKVPQDEGSQDEKRRNIIKTRQMSTMNE
jgi:hypothetical protein